MQELKGAAGIRGHSADGSAIRRDEVGAGQHLIRQQSAAQAVQLEAAVDPPGRQPSRHDSVEGFARIVEAQQPGVVGRRAGPGVTVTCICPALVCTVTV